MKTQLEEFFVPPTGRQNCLHKLLDRPNKNFKNGEYKIIG